MSEVTRDTSILHTEAVLTYADANEHALETTPTNIQEYKNIVLEIKVTTSGTTTAQTLTIGVATSCYELTGANAVAELTADYWTTEVITLTASADVFYYQIEVPAHEVWGNYIYTKYEYGADPTGDPTVEVRLNLI